MPTELIPISRMKLALREAGEMVDVLDIKDAAMAANALATARNMGEVAQEAKEVQIRAERKGGTFLEEYERGKPPGKKISNSVLPISEYAQALEDNNISKMSSSRWQKMASIPEEKFDKIINDMKDSGKELSQAGVLRAINGAHVGQASGENEWYTPKTYIESARKVMGEIDLDPASSETANEIVQAIAYFTEEDDGLLWEWGGRIWMNPPYSQPLIAQFCQKLAESITSGTVEEAIILVNNATETKWFRQLAEQCGVICFPRSRIRFIDKEGNKGKTPLQAQAIIYIGPSTKVDIFAAEFKQYGTILYAR